MKNKREASNHESEEERGDDGERNEYKIDDVDDDTELPRTHHLVRLTSELELRTTQRIYCRENIFKGILDICEGCSIHPNNRWYRAWEKIILVWAIYSSFFTPLEFGFFRGLPKRLFLLDISGQIAFLVDVLLQFFVAYRDGHSYKLIYKRSPIAIRYLKSHFLIDILACLPWDIIYKACGNKEEVRCLLWIRLSRVRKVLAFFRKMEKDIRVNYLFCRIVKLIVVELYCTHTAACIFYYLATTLPEENEEYTWIGNLQMGDYSYMHFREIDLWKRYVTSLYFAIVTMTTVGYGDIHAVNLREMIFIMIYVSLDMVLSAYLVGNMTALIVKGSKTEKYRDKMAEVIKYMNRNRLGGDIRDQVKSHFRLRYESSSTDAAVLQDLPISIRTKIAQTLYKSYIEDVYLFKGCSSEFINQLVTKVHEEFFLPGELIVEVGSVVDHVYIVCHGVLEKVWVRGDESEEKVSLLRRNSLFGELSIFRNIPQPYTVRVCELCRLLRVDKQSFSDIFEIYFHDGRTILNNLLEHKESNLRVKQLETDITSHIGKQEAELSLRVNNAAFYGDLYQLKGLIRLGADPNKQDYDGRSSLHLAASRGYEDITQFLILEGVDINILDNFGNTPLFEAIKNGHDRVASLLKQEGAYLKFDDAGTFMCTTVAKGDIDLTRRVLDSGIDPNSKDYDLRTPLHVAASQGICLLAKLLLEAGASVLSKNRWGNTPLDEARMSGNKNLIKLLEEAKSTYNNTKEITDKLHSKKCTVFPFHPKKPNEAKDYGVVLWVPQTIEELIKRAAEELNSSGNSCILSEDSGKILDVDMISDGQKLYLISETHQS